MVAESLAWQESDVKDTVKSNVSETHCLTIGMIVAAQCSYKQSWRLSYMCVCNKACTKLLRVQSSHVWRVYLYLMYSCVTGAHWNRIQ